MLICPLCKKQEGLIESLRQELKLEKERAEKAEAEVEMLHAELGYYDAYEAMKVLKAQNDALQAENKRLRSFAEHRLHEFGECFCKEIEGKCETCLAEEALKSKEDGK